MELQKAINNRHSIRAFENKIVSKSILKKLILNASKAPSAKNEQPWNFYVAYTKTKRDIIAGYYYKRLEEFSNETKKMPKKFRTAIAHIKENMGGCPHVIFAFIEKRQKAPIYQFQNDIAGISCAIENLMLSAVESGLGTCWIGTLKDDESNIKKLMNIPSNQELIATIFIGYPKKGYKPLIRKKRKLSEILKFV